MSVPFVPCAKCGDFADNVYKKMLLCEECYGELRLGKIPNVTAGKSAFPTEFVNETDSSPWQDIVIRQFEDRFDDAN